MSKTIDYRPLHVPREQGAALIDPPLAAAGDLVEQSRQLRNSWQGEIAGRRIGDLAQQARRELVSAAVGYSRQLVDLPGDPSAETVLLSGHQPTLYHPGVWFKNFALAELARQQEATPINLIIDNDTMRSCAIRVPHGPVQRPGSENVAFDQPMLELPFEERPIRDQQLFASFGERVQQVLGGLIPHPLLGMLWPLALQVKGSGRPCGGVLAAARLQLEHQLGLSNLEVPLSRLCQQESFHWFVAHLLAHLPRLWEVYNAGLEQYRAAHGIGNRAQPMPDLSCEEQWLEVPLWIWSDKNPQRRRLLARQVRGQVELTDRGDFRARLALCADTSAGRAVEQLSALAERGVKIRTRALTTTLFARLLLGDLFIHGIGGAKYDQLTDWLLEAFFGVTPPHFMTATATLQLPIKRPRVEQDQLRRVEHTLRDLRYNPDRHVNIDDLPPGIDRQQVQQAIEQKQHAVHTAQTPENAPGRHRQITAANERLQAAVEMQRQHTLAKRESLLRQLRAQSILASREYAFCLYPRETTSRMLLEILQRKA